ncbi:MAG: cell division protein FtsZ [Bacteroidales bacterium]|nr:cell division protein FtsZ [Bacteroidales bacterium]
MKHKEDIMGEDLNINLVPDSWQVKQNIIKVVGVGGGGCNAVNQMFRDGINDVEFLVCNTDSQSLIDSPIIEKLQLGEGLGAGCDPEEGRRLAVEKVDEIKKRLSDGTKMLFITAGMGGGTGTGAAPVIAKISKEMGILTIAVVTQPFRDEGTEFLRRAYEGIQELSKNVDSLLIIDNQKIYDIYGDLDIWDAFPKADAVLQTAIKGIAEIITGHGYINVDFADVRRVMKDSGMAIMGSGEASGANRAEIAVERAFTSPLIKDYSLKSAKNVLINITSSRENSLKMSEMEKIIGYVTEYTGNAFNFKRGVAYDDKMEAGTIRVTIVATGLLVHLTPPPAFKKARDMGDEIDLEENEITVKVDTAPDNKELGIKLSPFNMATTTIYTQGMNITDMENETAFARRQRKEKELNNNE